MHPLHLARAHSPAKGGFMAAVAHMHGGPTAEEVLKREAARAAYVADLNSQVRCCARCCSAAARCSARCCRPAACIPAAAAPVGCLRAAHVAAQLSASERCL